MNPAEIVGIGGPVGAAALVVGYFLRFLIQRKGAERQSESGIVETTNATLKMVRENQDVMGRELRNLRDENTDLRERLRLKDEQIDKLYDQNRELAERIDELLEHVQQLEHGDKSSPSTARAYRHRTETTSDDTDSTR